MHSFVECLRNVCRDIKPRRIIEKRKYIEAMRRIPWNTETGDGILCRSIYGNFVGKHEFIVDAKESARAAIAALSVPFLSMPNNGSESLYAVIEAAAARI